MAVTYDALQIPPTAQERGGIEVLRAGVVEGGLHVMLRRAFNDPRAWGILLADVSGELAGYADVIDRRDYGGPGQQSLEFSDLSDMVRASAEAGLATDVVAAVQALVRRQIETGHGADGFARAVESIREPARTPVSTVTAGGAR